MATNIILNIDNTIWDDQDKKFVIQDNTLTHDVLRQTINEGAAVYVQIIPPADVASGNQILEIEDSLGVDVNIQNLRLNDLNGQTNRYIFIDRLDTSGRYLTNPNYPIVDTTPLPPVPVDYSARLNKPVMRIAVFDYTTQSFFKIGEMDKYTSYHFELNHNAASTGEIIFDPAEPQAKELIDVLNLTGWDAKLTDIFFYNLDDELEFFKVEVATFENKKDQRKVKVSGTNTFFLASRLYLPPENLDKFLFTDLPIGVVLESIIFDTIIDPIGQSPEHIEFRKIPYIEIIGDESTFTETITAEFGFENVHGIADNLFENTLYGYRIAFDVANDRITFQVALPDDKSDIKITQHLKTEDGYTTEIESNKKTDGVIARDSSITYLLSDPNALSGARYQEDIVDIGDTETTDKDALIASELERELISTQDYKTIDISIRVGLDELIDEIYIGDVITIEIEDIVKITKTAQIKQVQKVATDDTYKITHITDGQAQTAIQILAKKIRDSKNAITNDHILNN